MTKKAETKKQEIKTKAISRLVEIGQRMQRLFKRVEKEQAKTNEEKA